MLFFFVLYFASWVIMLALGALPSVPWTSEQLAQIATTTASWVGNVWILNEALPLQELMWCFGIAVGLYVAMLGYRGVMTIVNVLRGAGA